MFNEVQAIAVAVVVIVAAVFVGRASQKSQREERLFFRNVVDAITALLTAKGYQSTRERPTSKVMLLYLATFERGTDVIELAWDGKEREVMILRHDPDEANLHRTETIASARLPHGATASHYDEATGLLIRAADGMRRIH